MSRQNSSSRPTLDGSSLRAAIQASLRKFLDPNEYDVFLFGSEASAIADQYSDIDIGILGVQPVPGALMQRIREDLETLRTLRSFDVVDFSRVDESFKLQALQHVERL